ncbi:pyridoxine/pyridoxamine 5'-phosphate oxidase 2 isoform X2 [Neltuma alba]|uniref:pyridoxine/pyridoxamine 5'-phosphate oxidase 2 isoform X2 n=1 Tax=Neltuma alba TaxID=207710 RepID=UPI0010A31E5B|nr:pyridoxine/pyridoxamine 5'-phosphate oxidase 2 isoform X2 [Prosopis alba]
MSATNSQATRMAISPWKQLLMNALESNSHLKHSTFFQLATIGTNGRPSNRTVVFRGFQDNTDKIQINTDGRSRKIEELKHCSSGEQREKSWFASSLRSRLQYLGPNPGLPCLSEETQREISLDPSTGPVDAFCLLILDPDQVDYLNLKSNLRLTYKSSVSATAEKSWSVERVNP